MLRKFQTKITFLNHEIDFNFKHKNRLRSTIQRILEDHQRELQTLTYIFCSDEFLYNLNRQYLNHSTYTDIISFDLSDNLQKMAEIYISVSRVKENALTIDSSISTELQRVIFHGALHLCGYKDKTEGAKKIMRKTEDFYLKFFNRFT